MAYREGRFDEELLKDIAGFRAYLSSAKVVKDKAASEVAKRWRGAAPDLSFRHFFFDDIAGNAPKAREDILTFLGAGTGLGDGQKPADYNRKGKTRKLEITDAVKAVLVEHLADELRACAAVFGGHAKNWITQYGLAE